jgi:SAM-dependent methyltransferase
MADWDEGYVTDVPYVAAYHRETVPIWIATAATILGNTAPDIARPFRYADVGCGNGVTPLIVAATMPHAEVWAFDFNPNHIAAGRDIARRAGLANIRFVEASFEELARQPPDPPLSSSPSPMFDFVVAHGVLSWISRENQQHLYTVINRRLAPGGIAYVSYNVSTGWVGVRPMATLMRLLAESTPRRTDLALAAVFDTIEKMKDAGAAMFEAHPALGVRLAAFRANDQRYVAHELLNGNWQSLMFETVATAMAGIKCEYVCNATLQDNIAGLTVPSVSYEMFGQARDVRQRETLRDLFAGIAFRRDLYQRGARRMSPLEHRRETDAITLVRTFRPEPETIMLEAAIGRVKADQQRFRAILRALDAGPTTIGQLRHDRTFASWPDAALLEVVTLLISTDYVAPVMAAPPEPAAIAAAARLNQVHAALFERGEDRPWLAYPALGAAWTATPFELMALEELRAGRAAEEQPLVDAVQARVARTGRQLRQTGQSAVVPTALRDLVANVIRDTLRRLPAMRRLGALDPVSTAPCEGARSASE